MEGAGDPTHEQHDGCGVKEGARGVDSCLEVLCQPSIASNPREEPLDDPAAGVNSEADLIGVLAHDLDPSPVLENQRRSVPFEPLLTSDFWSTTKPSHANHIAWWSGSVLMRPPPLCCRTRTPSLRRATHHELRSQQSRQCHLLRSISRCFNVV